MSSSRTSVWLMDGVGTAVLRAGAVSILAPRRFEGPGAIAVLVAAGTGSGAGDGVGSGVGGVSWARAHLPANPCQTITAQPMTRPTKSAYRIVQRCTCVCQVATPSGAVTCSHGSITVG